MEKATPEARLLGFLNAARDAEEIRNGFAGHGLGIGPELAGALLDFVAARRPLADAQAILAVHGIGETRLRALLKFAGGDEFSKASGAAREQVFPASSCPANSAYARIARATQEVVDTIPTKAALADRARVAPSSIDRFWMAQNLSRTSGISAPALFVLAQEPEASAVERVLLIRPEEVDRLIAEAVRRRLIEPMDTPVLREITEELEGGDHDASRRGVRHAVS